MRANHGTNEQNTREAQAKPRIPLSVERQPSRVAAIQQAQAIHEWVGDQPFYLQRAMIDYHDRATRDRGVRAANIELREHVERYAGDIPANASDATLKKWGDARASEVHYAILKRHQVEPGADLMADWVIGRDACIDAGIEPARIDDPEDWRALRGAVRRMRCGYWWRGRIRRAFGRRVEQSARALGLVRRRRGYAISDDGFQRWRERTAANQRALADCVAVGEDGTEISLADIAAAGVSNPRVRRAEMMAHIRGLERVADERGDVGMMVTMTVPPELHAYDSNGRLCAGQHRTPIDGQAWLCNAWAKARAAMDRRGLVRYGMRVAEPHADGTPHWHMLLFVAAEHAQAVDDCLRSYVIAGSTDPSRIANGYDSTPIDRSRGSAVGYAAKYVAKCIDGHALDAATTRGEDGRQVALDLDPKEAANRVRAWASQWGIRQYQFVGSAPLGVWRELRRLAPFNAYRCAHSDALERVEQLRDAADRGEFAEYIQMMGGPCRPGRDRPARVRELPEDEGRYGETVGRAFLEAFGRQIATRHQRWTIEYRPGEGACQSAGQEIDRPERPAVSVGAAGAPWTRVNNCTRPAGGGSASEVEVA